jgi:hypothetical protein
MIVRLGTRSEAVRWTHVGLILSDVGTFEDDRVQTCCGGLLFLAHRHDFQTMASTFYT